MMSPQDPDVIFEVNGPVYEAVALVRTAKRLTSSTGRFVFMYSPTRVEQTSKAVSRRGRRWPLIVNARAEEFAESSRERGCGSGGGRDPPQNLGDDAPSRPCAKNDGAILAIFRFQNVKFGVATQA